MAKRIVSTTTTTLTAFADAANLTDALYPFLLQGGSSTQRVNILEVYIGGQMSASAIAIMLLSRDSTVAATNSLGTGQNDAAADPSTAALAAPALVGNTNTTKPQRSSSLHLLNLTFNAFGGIVKWNPGTPDQAPAVLGNTASLGEVSLSAFTGSTASTVVGAHMVYEPL
jgi:hypothetical protein